MSIQIDREISLSQTRQNIVEMDTWTLRDIKDLLKKLRLVVRKSPKDYDKTTTENLYDIVPLLEKVLEIRKR